MIRPWLDRLSTGMKMLLILTAALLPLGLLALFASIESVQTNTLRRKEAARVVVAQGATQLSGAVARQSLELQQLIGRLGDQAPTPARCTALLNALALSQRYPVSYALYRHDGRRLCATKGFDGTPVETPPQLFGSHLRLLPASDRLRFAAGLGGGALFGVGELPRAALADLARPLALNDRHALTLREGGAAVELAQQVDGSLLQRRITVRAPIAGGGIDLEMTVAAAPITALELAIAVLPLMMWAAAALIGWLVVDRVIIRPLLRMQRAIAAYEPGAAALRLPPLRTPAQELRALGDSFVEMTDRVAQHEHDLEAGLARQTRLTREVHHRVKNNLQVVSSLINLHARGVSNPDVSAAYASIQRRVDALAVVHRNHYAELEENRGVGLRALVGELAANLRGTAPDAAAHFSITLDILSASVTQDVAVPVAFLVTEIVELAMSCDPRGGIAVAVTQGPAEDAATLVVSAPGLAAEACRTHDSLARFDRVVEGLSRQLRAKLHRDGEAGRFTIAIPIVTRPIG